MNSWETEDVLSDVLSVLSDAMYVTCYIHVQVTADSGVHLIRKTEVDSS